MRSRILLFFIFIFIFFLQKLRNDLEIIRCHMAFHLTERDNLMIYKFITYLPDQGTQSIFNFFIFKFLGNGRHFNSVLASIRHFFSANFFFSLCY